MASRVAATPVARETAESPVIRVLACQLAIPPVDSAASRDAHSRKTAEKLGRALETEPADLVVLPELSAMSYSRETFNRLDQVSESLEGPSADIFGEVADRYRTHVAFGIARRDGERVYISHVIVGPDGRIVGCYDKLHMAHFGACTEKDYFSRGDHLLVFDVKGITVTPVICYDFRFPDLVATLCREHAVRLVIHPVAFFRDGTFPSWHPVAITRAVENHVYFLSLNRAGKDFGQSLWCPPWVDERLQPEPFGTGEDFRYFTAEAALIDRIRTEYPYGSDRRRDYGRLGVQVTAG